MCVLLFDVFNECSLVPLVQLKRKNRLINRKLTFSKLRFSWKENLGRNALTLKSKKVHGIFRETFILALPSSAVFRLQNTVSDFF